MPFRRLPNTDAQRFCALQTCKLKADATLPADRAISAANFTLLTTLFDQFHAALGSRTTALGNQIGATNLTSESFNIARQYISHFIQTLNMAIDRHYFPASARAYYNLDVSSGKLPPLAGESDVLLWGQRLIDGEAARIATGEQAISFPQIGEVATALDNFKGQRQLQSAFSETTDANEEAVAALRPAVDLLVLDLWDEIEFAFRRQAPPSLRNKAREWGVVYDTRPGEPVDPPAPTPPPAP